MVKAFDLFQISSVNVLLQRSLSAIKAESVLASELDSASISWLTNPCNRICIANLTVLLLNDCYHFFLQSGSYFRLLFLNNLVSSIFNLVLDLFSLQ